jgi:hypothetical protein
VDHTVVNWCFDCKITWCKSANPTAVPAPLLLLRDDLLDLRVQVLVLIGGLHLVLVLDGLPVPVQAALLRVALTPGCQIGYTDCTGCHQLEF